MNNKYGYRLVDILRGADGSRQPEECRGGDEMQQWRQEGDQSVVPPRGWLVKMLLLHFYTILPVSRYLANRTK